MSGPGECCCILWKLNRELDQRVKSMTIVLEEKDEELKKKNVINLEEAIKTRKALGGGGSGETRDWLSPLNIHAVFWAKQKKDATNFVLSQYQVVFKGDKARSLKVTLNSFMDRPDECIVINVDPVTFCEMNHLYEIIRKGDECE